MRRTEWRRLPGAFAKPRRLQVQRSKDGLYFCPIDFCDHNGFLSQRGCRKHTKTKHGWYFYFDKKPKTGDDPIKAKSKEFCSPDRRQKQQKVPSFSTSTISAAEFQHWLQSVSWILAEFYFNRGLQRLYTGICIILQKTINGFLCLLIVSLKSKTYQLILKDVIKLNRNLR